MSTHNIGFYEDLAKIIFELSSNIIKYAPYFFCWACTFGIQKCYSKRKQNGKLAMYTTKKEIHVIIDLKCKN